MSVAAACFLLGRKFLTFSSSSSPNKFAEPKPPAPPLTDGPDVKISPKISSPPAVDTKVGAGVGVGTDAGVEGLAAGAATDGTVVGTVFAGAADVLKMSSAVLAGGPWTVAGVETAVGEVGLGAAEVVNMSISERSAGRIDLVAVGTGVAVGTTVFVKMSSSVARGFSSDFGGTEATLILSPLDAVGFVGVGLGLGVETLAKISSEDFSASLTGLVGGLCVANMSSPLVFGAVTGFGAGLAGLFVVGLRAANMSSSLDVAFGFDLGRA